MSLVRLTVLCLVAFSCISCGLMNRCDFYERVLNDKRQRDAVVAWADRCFSYFPLDERLVNVGALVGPGSWRITEPRCTEDIPISISDLEVRVLGDDSAPRGLFVGHTSYQGLVVQRVAGDDLLDLRGLKESDIVARDGRIMCLCRLRGSYAKEAAAKAAEQGGKQP